MPAMPALCVPNNAMNPLNANGPRKLTARPVVAYSPNASPSRSRLDDPREEGTTRRLCRAQEY